MKFTKALIFGLASLSLVTMSACNTNSDNKIQKEGRLSIVYYPGGYGTEYLNTFVKEFLAKKNGKSVDEIKEGDDYLLVPDEDITYGADYYLTSDARCPDLIISNLLSPKAVTQGYVANLDDVFDATIETSKGSKKISEFVMEEAVDQYTYELRRGQTAKHRFAMPWSAIPLSIAYNNTLLKQISHIDTTYTVGEDAISDGKWVRAPETVDELLSIFKDLDGYNSSKGTNLAKIGWAAKNGTNWFESLITTWWAQRQGVDTPYLYPTEGSYYDFWKYDSAEIFKQTGLQDALKQIQDIFVGDGNFINSYNSVGSMTIKNAQQAFAEGKALFCLTGDFFEKEYSPFIEESGQEFKMMRVPSIANALKNEDNSVKKLTYINISSCAYVPNKGANKELAKEFLKFTATEEYCQKFSNMTGGIRPVDYDVRTPENMGSFSEFKKSVFDLYYDCDDYLLKYPRNVDIEDISPIYLYEGVSEQIFAGVTYFTVLSNLKSMTPKQIMIDGTSSFDSVYDRAVKLFNEWKRQYDL